MLRIVDSLPNGALLRSLEAKYKAPITPARAKTLGIKPRDAIVKTADILEKRIVYPYEVPTSADSATDALAVVLSETGLVDIDRIAELTGQTAKQVIDELHTSAETPVVFQDPETGRWETADEYLGGNVVRKLEAAKQAEMDRNIAALEKVQPEPWTADKVTVSIGATWVPGKVYAAFLEHLTGAPGAVTFSRLTNTFSVEGNSDTADAKNWNTPGRNVVDLVGNILNSQAIKVTRTVSDGHGGTHTYVDTEATQAANDMAEALKEEFSEWVFRDSGRRRELVDLFNRKFNVRVTKQRDGSHLKFPGKVPDHIIKLRRHQVNGIWRGIVDRFVLYDHAVGSGKTFTAIARAIERKRMGLSKKPMMVVPNHILEQVAKDVYTLYPGAKVLAAGTKDLSKANRRRLFARIATGDWDLVIVPHSSFQFIGISPDTEERYLQEELELAIQAVEEAEAEADAEGFNGRRKPLTVKEAERLRDNIEARLAKVKERAAKRDNLLTFEQMGIDDLTVDESHEFKNLFYHSKLNVRGMNPKAGSAKAYDLWSKVRVLREMKNGSVAFMTGTPVSNSAVELYGIMRYLAADTLEEMGLEHFDAWRSQFATVTTAFEPKESGRGLKEVNRIGRDWSNMRSLMDLYYSFADAVSNDDIKKWYKEDNDGAEFPIPKVKGGGRRSVNVEPSAVQESIIEQIVQGFDDLPNIEDVDERNAERLRLMDLARKVSLDARAVDPYIQDNGEGGKLAQVAVEVKRIYDAWHNDRGTQLIFLDRSVPKSKGDAATIAKYDSLVRQLEQAEESGDEAAAMKLSDQLEKYDHDEMASLKAAQQGGWNAYDEIKKRLIESGIPADEIRYVQEATTDDQKKMLFEEVNAGKVRILFGSTPRMGAGTNVQERLVGLHHVDVTWKPSDIEQREGRIIRQGNSLLEKYGDNFEVEILAYTTNRTVDAKLWSLNATKLKMINGLRHYTGDFNVEFDDSDSVGMAEIAAIASGEPLQLERVQLASEIDKLNRQKRAHQRRIFGMKDELDDHQRALKNEQTAGTFEQYAGIYAGIEEKAGRREVTITYGDETETFTFDQAAEAKSYITGFAEKAAESEEKFSINVGGKKYTSKSKAHDAVQAALGDGVPFEAELEGETYISRSALDKTITGKVKDAVDANLDPSDPQAEMDETPIGSVRFGDLEVNLSAQVVVGGRMGSGEQILEVFAEARIGETWLVNNNVLGKPGKDGKNISEVVRGLSGGIARRIKEFPAIVQRLKEKADKAREMIPKLESLVEEPFQREQELEEKQRRLEEVERELSASADAAPATDNNPVMSRKIPQEQARLTKQQVLQTIGPILQNWKNAPRIEAVQSVKDLPAHLKDYIFSADPYEGAGIDGVFDPKTGTIFLIADALPDAQRAQHVLLHEVVGHYGLRGLLGKDFKAILDQIGMVRRKDLRPIAARWGYDLNTPEGRRGAAEEWLAEIAGRGETNGFIRRTIAAIRDALRKMGFDLEYSDADLVQLVAKARKYVEQGEAGTGSGGIKFSRSASAASPARIAALQAKADAMPDSAEKTSLLQKVQAMQGVVAAPTATATTPQPASKHKAPTKTSAPGRLSAAVQPRLDYLRMKFQDKFIPLKRTQQALKKQGWNEREDNNPYLAEELSHGIAKDRLDKFEDEQVQPLMDEIKAAPVSLDELEQYLYARHVPERNAYIQKINPEFEEGGSGMTDQEAAAVIDRFRADGKLKVLNDLAKKVWALGEMQRRIIREEGLEEQERLDAWESFDYYVPLKGAPDGLDEGHGRSIGRGFAVVKSGTKSALGRHSEAENILAHLVAQVADTIVRAERAKVGKAFLQMVEENPDPALWTVRTKDNLPTREVLAKNPAYTALQGKLKRRQDALQKATDGAEIERLQDEIAELRLEMDATPARQVAEVDDFEWIKADNVLPVTRDGKVHYIQIENQDLARVMKNLGAADQGKAIRALARLNRTLAMVNTSLNPEFVITNFERDFQTAMINLSGEQSAKLAAKVAKGIPAAMKGIRSTLRGSGTADMSQWYERFKAAGAQVGYLDLQNIDQTQRQIQKLVREQDGKLGTVWKYVQKVGKFIGDYNTMVENAVRLSAFKTAIENGMSEAKAASLAKNLTVNFNRKGELGPAANALYLFFNAGVQGSARIITSLAKSKRTRKICAGITLTAFALAEINRLQAGDDDDDENRWDKVSDYTKHTNLLLMRGDESGDAFKVKLPYGYNMFVALGYTMSDVRAYLTSGGKHGKSPAQGAVSLFHAGMNAFNPLGGDDSLLQLISPTIMDPFVQVATNENFMGTPIMPNQPSFGPPKPKSEMYWSSVRPLSMAISKQLNELTGGSSVEPGVVDISPEVLDHFWDFATGGAGRFYADSINAMAAMARGEELSIRRVPFARQVYQEKSDYYDRQNLHNHMDKVTAHYGLFKEMMETGRKGDAMRYRQEHPEIALKRTADHLRRRLTKLRQGKEKLENVDKERYKDRIERIEREIQRLTMAFNRKYNQTVTR
jgi:N12 class adenine-specific DNA methylase